MQSKYLLNEVYSIHELLFHKFMARLDNVNVRMGMPAGLANSQPRMVRPVLNLNYMPNNNNNPHGLAYRYAAPGISFRYK
jgi:hypothetical protein